MSKTSETKLSTIGKGAGIIALVILVGLLDYITGPAFGFSIFYLIPIAAGAWMIGRRFGIMLSFLGALIWFSADALLPTTSRSIAVELWNGGVRLGIFLITTALISRVKLLNKRLETKLSDTVSALTITENLSKELEQQASLLLKGVEQVRDAVLITDKNGTIQYVNPAWEKMTGYKRTETLGKTPRILKSGKHPDTFYESLWKTILDGGTWATELINKTKDGRFIDIEQTISPIFDRSGLISHFIGVERDISERKRAEAGLKLFRTLLDRSNDAIEVLDPETGQYIDINERSCQDLGYSREELLSLRVSDIDPTVDQSSFARESEELRRLGTMISNGIHRRKDGSTFPVEVSLTYISLDRNYIVSVVRNVTERQQAEDVLRESEERYRRFFEEDLTGDYISTPEGELLQCNLAFVQIFGFASLEDALKTNVGTLFKDPNHRETFLHLLIEKKKLIDHESEMVRIDKKPVYVIENAVGTFDEHGELLEIKGYVFNNTFHHTVQDQLIRAQKMESIGTLASGIAHDLNNVLGPIMIGLDIVRKSIQDPKALKMLDTMMISTERGADILKQILSIARRDEGEKSLVQPKHLVHEVVRLVKSTFPKHINVHEEIGKDIPTIVGDSTQLHQILLNLCVNARDAISTHGDLTIGLEAIVIDESFARSHVGAEQGPYVVFSVTDTGTGMSQEVKNRVFEPFFTTKIQRQGTGLGLFTVSSLVKQHGGFVTLYSEEGKGTTLRVYIPSIQEKLAKRAVEPKRELPVGQGELILVVDDEDSIREIMKVMLAAHNYRVLTAVDGVEAIATYANQKNEIALVIMDMMMPLMDGSQAIGVLKKISSDVKIIAVSGLTSNGKTGAIPMGDVVTFLRKPFSSETILKAIADALASAGTKRESGH